MKEKYFNNVADIENHLEIWTKNMTVLKQCDRLWKAYYVKETWVRIKNNILSLNFLNIYYQC
jgi:hypothetical protein